MLSNKSKKEWDNIPLPKVQKHLQPVVKRRADATQW